MFRVATSEPCSPFLSQELCSSRLLKNDFGVRRLVAALVTRQFPNVLEITFKQVPKRRQVAALQKGWLSRISFSATCQAFPFSRPPKCSHASISRRGIGEQSKQGRRFL